MINVDGTPIHGTIVAFNRVKLSLFIIFITRDVKNIFQNVCRFEQDFKKRFVKILDIRLNWGKSSVVFSFFSLVNIQFGKKKKIHIYFKFYSSRILSLPGGKGRILEYVWTEKSLEQQRISVKEDLRWGEPLSIQLKDHWFKKIWLKEKKKKLRISEKYLTRIRKKICGKKSFFTKDLDVQSLWSCNII